MPDNDRKGQLRGGFQRGGDVSDLFRGAASYFAEFRRPYPEDAVSYLVGQFCLDGNGRLLDVGCGTGNVFRALGPYFARVVALDSDADMVRYARQTAESIGMKQSDVLELRAEEIGDQLGKFRMATFGASFHWMDRQKVAELVYDRLEPNGHIVVISSGGFHNGQTDWEAEVRNTLGKWLGNERRAGSGVYRAGEFHQEALRKTRFRDIQVRDITVQQSWSIDQIIGCLYSTSYASKSVLGDQADGFERDLRRRLESIRPERGFEKLATHTIISARRHG